MLREPCVHGRYDAHELGSTGFGQRGYEVVFGGNWCPGGRPLTDAEVLERLLYQNCRRCRGCGDDETGPEVRFGACPSCAGTGHTLKDGVAERINHNGEPTLVVPMSMLKGK